jgi:8-oxo-dGTP diphosphatase
MDYHYQYPRPAVTVDILLISKSVPCWILLIQRLHDPFINQWALPGGFVNENEDLFVAAARELKEETNIEGLDLHQFRTYGAPFRDPRGHTVSVVFWGETDAESTAICAGDDAGDAFWFPIENLPLLAFDHHQIVTDFLSFFKPRYVTK